ncbi:MAG: HupE/UreJ family protein [Methylocystis sp.]|nr:HupE/UreJ family protein [Methylocystis sp.]MBI3274633.1 HupE/UreJ family protein [Methylocystis sp.]
MPRLWRRLAVIALSIFGFTAAALAHTADISTGKVVAQKERVYRVDVGFLATDLERMFSETMAERSGVDLSPPGVLETEIGKFVQRRVTMQDADGHACSGHVEKAGEDPTNADSALVVLRFDCAATGGQIFYNPAKLLAAQGPRGKHLVTVGDGPDAGQTMLYPGDPPLDLSKPLLTTWQLMAKFGEAGVEHIVTGYDHLCFLLALVLWAHRAWPVVKIVTAFTVSHSVTLSLAALDVVTLPTTLTESAIAASIVFVAVENFFSKKIDRRWIVTFLFGFIHGFGFASGLKELGVPRGAALPALVSFNIGVELGQIAIVLLVVPMLLLIDTRTAGERHDKLVYVGSGIVALFGAYWLLERVGVLA